MPRPSKLPLWATDGNNIVEPTPSKIASGWLPSEKPPAQYMNHMMELYGSWLRRLDDAAVLNLAVRYNENQQGAGLGYGACIGVDGDGRLLMIDVGDTGVLADLRVSLDHGISWKDAVALTGTNDAIASQSRIRYDPVGNVLIYMSGADIHVEVAPSDSPTFGANVSEPSMSEPYTDLAFDDQGNCIVVSEDPNEYGWCDVSGSSDILDGFIDNGRPNSGPAYGVRYSPDLGIWLIVGHNGAGGPMVQHGEPSSGFVDASQPPSGAPLTCVCWDGLRFVAGGSSGVIAYSGDGDAWSFADVPSEVTEQIRNIESDGQGRVVATTRSGHIVTTHDVTRPADEWRTLRAPFSSNVLTWNPGQIAYDRKHGIWYFGISHQDGTMKSAVLASLAL